MRTRAPSVAAVLRVVGLGGTLAGCVLTIAALSKTWAVDGPREGFASRLDGWAYLAWGDVALLGVALFVAVLAIALCVGPRSRKVSRTAGGGAALVLLAALAGLGIGYWLMGLDFSFFSSSDDLRRYDAGPGFGDAAVGLGVALLGLMVLLAGRWEARTRAALRRDAAAAAAPAAPTAPQG
jgi:GNAT superfamily N-acetyltransferase